MISRIANSSQSCAVFPPPGQFFFLAEFKKGVTQNGVYNAAVCGKIFLFLQIFGTKRCLGGGS